MLVSVFHTINSLSVIVGNKCRCLIQTLNLLLKYLAWSSSSSHSFSHFAGCLLTTLLVCYCYCYPNLSWWRYQQQQPRQYPNDSSERRPCLTLQYVGFTSFGASNMNKVETECVVLYALFLLVCLNFELRSLNCPWYLLLFFFFFFFHFVKSILWGDLLCFGMFYE